MSNQLDIAVDLGTVAPPLPEIQTMREFMAELEQEYGAAEKLQALRSALD